VVALEIDGSFDDCQNLVKTAFQDEALQRSRPLTSANSINIGRWLPQSIYYAWAVAQAKQPVDFVIPSGNFGNAAAGVLAQKMGVPAASFLAAVNTNASMEDYLHSGTYTPMSSIPTISNAMDVGNPSNRPRLEWLYNDRLSDMQRHFSVVSVDEEATKQTMHRIKNETDVLVCPHTAVGIHAAHRKQGQQTTNNCTVVLATAHAAKFGAVVYAATGHQPMVPDALQSCLTKPKVAVALPASYESLKSYLMDSNH
jgi:threonine synthase